MAFVQLSNSTLLFRAIDQAEMSQSTVLERYRMGLAVAMAYGTIGVSALAFQLIHRFGARGLLFVSPLLLVCLGIVGIHVWLQGAKLDLLFGGMGAGGVAVLWATRGRLERFPERDLLPVHLKEQTSDDDTHAVQLRTMGWLLLLLVPLFAANWSRI